MSACTVCGGEDRSPVHEVGSYLYLRCARCGMVALAPQPPAGAVPRIYSREYFVGGSRAGGYVDYAADEATHRRNARDRLELIRRRGPPNAGHLLDYGCGPGFFAAEAASAGWNVVGVDVSAYARSYARERLGLTVFAEPGDVVPPGGGFDVVCLFQVLEHTVDPLSELQALSSLAGPDSTFVVETWDRGSRVARLLGNRWHQVAPPSVTHLFDRATLAALLGSCGLEITWLGRTSKRVGLRHAAHAASDKLPSLLAKAVHRAAGLAGDRAVRYGLGDLITAVARPTRRRAGTSAERP